jgi:chitodextrinase
MATGKTNMSKMHGGLRAITVIALLTTGLVATSPAGQAIAAPPTATLPTDNPANWTPNVNDGQVNAIWQVGGKVIIGGTFTQVQNATSNGGATYARSGIAAFNATTGMIDTAFAPVLDGSVEAIVPAADGASVYIGGSFNTVNASNRRKIARIDVATGALVSTFNANGVDGVVRDVRLVGTTVYIGGQFTLVNNQPRTYLASLDAQSGALTSKLDLAIAGLHNGGTTKVIKMDVTPDGSRLLVIGNFTTVAGQPRDQIALINLATNPATVSPWQTDFYTSSCASVFDTFMRDLDISEDGSFAAVSTTGAYRANTSCDTISRFELGTEQSGLSPTWISYTGGDTTYAVEIHAGVIYVGGHMRWVNNPYSADRHGAGGIARQGMAALDTVTGLPFSWNPGRERGVGLFDYFVTPQGIWAGSDTDRFNGELRKKLAFFPWAGGTLVSADSIGALPNDVYQLGRTSGASGTVDPSVLYRVNAGGPALASVDDGPDWMADTASSSPYRNGGTISTAPNNLATPTNDSTVPKSDVDRPPAHLFTTERYDPAGGSEMTWNFPVSSGTPITVRLYLSNRCRCTEDKGARIFDVVLDGATVIDNLDLSGDVGHDVGTMRSFDVVSDGNVDIDFVHGAADNPLIDGIEIIRRDIPAGGTFGTRDDVIVRSYDGVGAPTASVVVPGTAPWSTVRAAFMVNSTLYTLHVDGTIMARALVGQAVGPGVAIDMWSNDVMSDMASMTGIFFDPSTARIYYTLAGQNNLYVRPFLAESHMIGATRTTATGAIGALVPSRVSGMFLGDGQLFFGDAATGDLLSMPYSAGVVSGTPSVADATVDWRSRALFRSSGISPNVAPTATFAANCTANACTFDAAGSNDADGVIESYEWTFGDGSTGTGGAPQHAYAGAGTYTVTLTVTDDRNGTAQFSRDVAVTDPPNVPPVSRFTASCNSLTCSFDGRASSDPDGSIVSYRWTFGDGASGTRATTGHTYAREGVVTVRLTVTDNRGAATTKRATVRIGAGGIEAGGAAVHVGASRVRTSP